MDIIKSLLDCLYNNGKAIVCLYKEDSWGDINICFEMGKNYNLQLRETFFSSKENTNENILATDEIKTIINLIIKRALLNSSIRKINIIEPKQNISCKKLNLRIVNELYRYILSALNKYNINKIMSTYDDDLIKNNLCYNYAQNSFKEISYDHIIKNIEECLTQYNNQEELINLNIDSFENYYKIKWNLNDFETHNIIKNIIEHFKTIDYQIEETEQCLEVIEQTFITNKINNKKEIIPEDINSVIKKIMYSLKALYKTMPKNPPKQAKIYILEPNKTIKVQ